MTKYSLALFMVMVASVATATAERESRHLAGEKAGHVRKGRAARQSNRALSSKKSKGDSSMEDALPGAPEATLMISMPSKGSKKSASIENTEAFQATVDQMPLSSKSSKKGSDMSDSVPPPPPPPSGTDTREGDGGFSIQIDLGMSGTSTTAPAIDEPEVRVEDVLIPIPFDDLLIEDRNVTSTNESSTIVTTPISEPVLNSTFINGTGTFVKLVDDETACMSFNETTFEVLDCDEAGDLAVWEIVESEEPSLFQLRHVESQLCIPENPEFPDRSFNCWIAEENQAIADTINGLVDCSSPSAAFVGFIDPQNPFYLYNAVCSTGDVGAPSDIVLLAYTMNNVTQLLWGEKVLLDRPQMTSDAPYTLNGNWIFADV